MTRYYPLNDLPDDVERLHPHAITAHQNSNDYFDKDTGEIVFNGKRNVKSIDTAYFIIYNKWEPVYFKETKKYAGVATYLMLREAKL